LVSTTMRIDVCLFFLLSLNSFNSAHPWGDLSLRHRRGEDTLPKGSDQEGTSTGSEKEFFFSEKRVKEREEREKKEIIRPVYSKVGKKCSVKIKKMSDLADVTVTNLYQCPNYRALILVRGAGMFDIDWENKQEVNLINGEWICSIHEAELGRNWQNAGYNHFRRKERQGRKIYDPICSMPLPFEQQPVVLHENIHY
ncbi:hypothetical protein PMAYCL1PPCAC_11516, partial [Pristionchus mayeri]